MSDKDLTYEEERDLRESMKRAFRELDQKDLALIDRAWLKMGGAEFAANVHFCVLDVISQRGHGIEKGPAE